MKISDPEKYTPIYPGALLTRYVSVPTLQCVKVVHELPHWNFKGFKQTHIFKKLV